MFTHSVPVGSIVRVMPLSEAEMRTATRLMETLRLEVEGQRSALAEIGVRRRRIWLIREPTGPWLFDAIEGERELIALGPEAVWATSASNLDRWIATRDGRSYVGDLASVPAQDPTIELRFVDVDPANDAIDREEARRTN